MNRQQKLLKETVFDGVSHNDRKLKFRNRCRYAMKQIRAYVKKNGGTSSLHYDVLCEFCEIKNYSIPSKNGFWYYIYELYVSNDDEDVRRLNDPQFYSSTEWLRLRKKVLKKYGEICMKCSSTENIAVDHIKPRSLYQELELDIENLQVLCKKCNSIKSNKNCEDYRDNNNKTISLNN